MRPENKNIFFSFLNLVLFYYMIKVEATSKNRKTKLIPFIFERSIHIYFTINRIKQVGQGISKHLYIELKNNFKERNAQLLNGKEFNVKQRLVKKILPILL